MNPTLLIVDDEKHTREGLRTSLEDSFEVYVAPDIQGALNVLEADHVDLVLTDLRLGGEDGMQLVDKVLALPHPPLVIMMTAYGSVDAAVEAMKRGAYDFVTKPLNIDKLEMLITRALRSRETEKTVVELKKQVEKRYGLERLIGESGVMQEVFETIKQVAPTRATVLIQGESGTGKELVAQALHVLSGRPKEKFVAVHCAALTPELLASELFGHEKGAFTGAHERRVGRFEQANGGTIFLDEIGEIDTTTQVKLLRVLSEERAFERVGSNAPIKVDVRLVAATNKDLATQVKEGKFRDDLFFRLNVVTLELPPLRARKEDIPLLVSVFLKTFAKENNKAVGEITEDAMQAILRYDWPGNVRELRTAIEAGVVMATGPKVTLRHLPMAVRQGGAVAAAAMAPKFATPKSDYLDLQANEQQLIAQALEETRGNVTRAAKKLGISRRTLHRKLKELRQPPPRSPEPPKSE
ncbi:MAG: sigma-54 dependent transcriptional regulator [Verrucomicrobiota bacterium]|nr:sigma-54 dependent transcriptional regulator [Verrucomicrobiota bacterium]